KNRRWGLSQERIDEFEQKGKIRINKRKKYVDCFKNVIEEKPELYYDLELIRNDWLDIPGYSQVHKFSTENSEELLQRVIECGSKEDDIILDFFLGSGTTVAVAHKLKRKWIGIELGNQFEEFILPRMKTVLKGDKTGISKSLETNNGGFFKYHYIENIEDTIENLDFKPIQGKIILDFNKIEDPFNYTIKILENDRVIKKVVDLIETFNFLLGLFVLKITNKNHNGRNYITVKGKVNNEKFLVIWRSIIELDLNQDKKIIKEYLNEDNYCYFFTNGNCLLENFRSIELELKSLMWERLGYSQLKQ
ncbi:MAG: DNA methyltransferase, partial [Candidatus Hermodarchaeota archaeon]